MSAVLTDADPQLLRELGHVLIARADAVEERTPERVARLRLTDEGLERLADILIAGGQPTIGLFRRYRQVVDGTTP